MGEAARCCQVLPGTASVRLQGLKHPLPDVAKLKTKEIHGMEHGVMRHCGRDAPAVLMGAAPASAAPCPATAVLLPPLPRHQPRAARLLRLRHPEAAQKLRSGSRCARQCADHHGRGGRQPSAQQRPALALDARSQRRDGAAQVRVVAAEAAAVAVRSVPRPVAFTFVVGRKVAGRSRAVGEQVTGSWWAGGGQVARVTVRSSSSSTLDVAVDLAQPST
jgi:hypothetical protein